MKKLKLKLSDDKMLNKQQMKQITGGYDNQHDFICYCTRGGFVYELGAFDCLAATASAQEYCYDTTGYYGTSCQNVVTGQC